MQVPNFLKHSAVSRVTLTMILGASLVGCATNIMPDIAQSNIPVPQEWALSDPAPISVDISQYWTLLGDPLITEYVEAAILNNRDLAQSAARLDQARAQVIQARSGLLPSINGSGRASKSVFDLSQDAVSFNLGADASWEADLFGQISGNISAAEADLAASGYSLADLQRLIAGQVALNVITARSTAAQLDIAYDTLAYQDENLQIAEWRNQAGLVSSLDVEQARTQRAQTAGTIPSLESSLASTANSISTLIGEVPGAVYEQLDIPAPIPSPVEMSGFSAPAEVLRRRPDIRGAEASLLSATARVGVARAQMMPLVRLTGSIGTNSLGISNLFDIITGSLVSSVSQVIFDNGRTGAALDSAEAGARGSLAAWEASILGALEEVETAAVARRAASERLAINEEALDAANNSALLARSQYQAGITDFRTLLSAENSLLSARNQQISAQADRASAFVRLTQALGGGWDEADYSLGTSNGQTDSDRNNP